MKNTKELALVIGGAALLCSLSGASAAAATNQPPVVRIVSPLQGQVARPLIHVVATCVDDAPAGCLTMTVSDCPSSLESGSITLPTSTLDIYVRPCNGRVQVSGTDFTGQTSLVARVDFLPTETSPTLRTIAAVDGEIVDLRDTRVAYVHNYTYSDYVSAPGPAELWLEDFVNGGPPQRVPTPAGFQSPYTGFLSPHGAVFLSVLAGGTDSHIFEWRDGAIVDLGPYVGYGYLNHNERYAVWIAGADQRHLLIRDLMSGTMTDTLLPYPASNPAAGPNGDVVFQMNTAFDHYDITRYRAGVVTQLTTDPAFSYSDAVTDGINVSYARYSPGGNATLLYDTAEHVLADPGDGGGAKVNTGWVAYEQKLAPDTWQTFRRDPAGVTTQLTFSNQSSVPYALAPNGEVIVHTYSTDPSIRGDYLAVPGQPLRRIANDSHFLHPYYVNGRWLFTVGGHVFETLDACTTAVTPTSRAYGAPGGTGTFTVTANGDGCPWTVSGVPSWVTLYYGAAGNGNQSVRLGVGANAGAARSATFTVAGQSVTITQAAAGTAVLARRDDFTGDGRADRAVFRPYGGSWMVDGLVAFHYGHPWWIAVPADYDGDGLADIASFAPETATWWVRFQPVVGWGVPGDIPVPADYDGDGRADLAVFRPSLGRWLVKDQGSVDWGIAGDIPVPGDYDGDGRTDIAVFRPSTGTWFIRGVSGLPPVIWGRAGDIPVPADYDGDGRADIAVYRPSTGVWFVKDRFSRQYGIPGDLPVPLDYDGDGRAELAVYRRSTGTWFVENTGPGVNIGQPGDLPIGLAPWLWKHVDGDVGGDRRADAVFVDPASSVWTIQQSPNSFYVRDSVAFGASGDIRRTADFDGDGRGDLVLMRPSTGMWYVGLSSTSFQAYATYGPWGVSGDQVLPADYDGDGRADLMVFRPSTGRWYLRSSTSGYSASLTIDWGLPGDTPVPADYDGDGRADVAVYRPSNGRWYVIRSSDGSVLILDWGMSGDVAVPADYDGDGRADAAIFRPSTGQWWIRYSASDYTTFATIVFGASGDDPVPADYNGDGFAEPAYFRPGAGLFVSGLGQVAVATASDQIVKYR